jgi:molecular chaperone HscA
VDAVAAALTADGAGLLTNAERAAIDAALNALREARAGTDTQAIKRAIEAVDRSSADFAARRMNASIRKALAGKTLTEVKDL